MSVRWADLARMYPPQFVDSPWLVRNRLNLIIGEEEIGKSTFQMWYAARCTNGDLATGSTTVLVVGSDEDDFDSATLPRAHAAGADTSQIAVFEPQRADAFDIDALAHDLRAGKFGLVLIEHVLDVLPPLRNPNDPFEVRQKSRPLRQLLSQHKVTGLAIQHVNKAEGGSFRQRAQGSVQYNALVRSSMALGWHPSEPGRRAVVLGKANYTAERPARSFQIEDHPFVHAGRRYRIGVVSDLRDEELDVQAVLDARRGGAKPPAERPRDVVKIAILVHLRGGCKVQAPYREVAPCTLADVARAIGRNPHDGSVRNARDELLDLGWVKHDQDRRLQITEDGWQAANDNVERDGSSGNGFHPVGDEELERTLRDAR